MISVSAGPAETAEALAGYLVDRAALAIEARGTFSFALSGGSTPEPLYRLLALPAMRTRLDWRRVEIFWSDERVVPPADPASNHRMASEALLDHVPVQADRVHRIEGELAPGMAASRYDALLRARFSSGPTFDLCLLGLGDDGHVASLFPGSPALEEADRLAVAVRSPKPPPDRVTLTLPAINGSRAVVILATGAGKAAIVAAALGGDEGESGRLPVARIAPTAGELHWFLDSAAASALPPAPGWTPA